MLKRFAIPSIAAFVIAAIIVMAPPSMLHAQQPNVVRKVLIRQDLPIPGYEVVQVMGSLPPGGREGMHTHPGTLVAYVLEGAVTVERKGQPTVTYKAGSSFVIKAGVVHEGINNGKVPYKALVTYIVQTGKPLTTQVH